MPGGNTWRWCAGECASGAWLACLRALHIRQSAPGAVTRTTGNGARRRARNGKRDERWLEGCSGVGGCRTRGWLLSDTRLLLAGIDFFTGELEEQAHGCFV